MPAVFSAGESVLNYLLHVLLVRVWRLQGKMEAALAVALRARAQQRRPRVRKTAATFA